MSEDKARFVVKAFSSESFDGCHELERHDNDRWFSLGGVDIVVYDTEWTIYADSQTAIDYIVSVYELADVRSA